jgi:hypothetical protein
MTEIGLVSGVKTQTEEAAPPKKLYTSDYFDKMSSYAESNHDSWYILSAKHGLLEPDGEPIDPYNESVNEHDKSENREWAEWIKNELAEKGILSEDVTLVIHAGKDYYEELIPLVEEEGVTTEIPTKGKFIGETKKWYKDQL